MPLTIPDEAATLYAPQSAPDSTDMDAIVAAVGASGVISGCAVSAQAAPNMTVAVAAGTISSAGIPVGVAAVASLAIGAASPTDRRDLVVVDALGTVSVVAGTPGGAFNGSTPSGSRDPVKPAIPAGSVLLAEIYVAAQDTTVASGNITDKRVLLGDTISVAGRRGAVTLTAADIGAGTFAAGSFTFPGGVDAAYGTGVNSSLRVGGDTGVYSKQHILVQDTTQVGLTIKLPATNTADVLSMVNSAGAQIASYTAGGNIRVAQTDTSSGLRIGAAAGLAEVRILSAGNTNWSIQNNAGLLSIGNSASGNIGGGQTARLTINSSGLVTAPGGLAIPAGTWLQWTGGTGTPYITLAANGWMVMRMGVSGFIFESNDATGNPASWTNGGDLATNGFVKAGSRLNVYDDYSGIVGGAGKRPMLYAYHGIEVRGGRVSATVPTANAGSGTSDASMLVFPATANQAGLQVWGVLNQVADYLDVIDSTGYTLAAFTGNGLVIQNKTNASIELGRADGVGSTPYIDFHAGATAVDYDVRLLASNGTGANGKGTLSINAGQVIFAAGNVANSPPVVISGNPANRGTDIRINDTGVANQDKYLRVNSNNFQILNNAYTVALLSLSDGGTADFVNNVRVTQASTTHALGVAWNGAGADNDNYGIVGVTAPAGVNRAYYSMTAAGNSVYGMGMGTDNQMRIGGINGGKVMGTNVIRIDNVGNLFASAGTINDSSGRVYSPGNPPPGGATVKAATPYVGWGQAGNQNFQGNASSGANWTQIGNQVSITCGPSGVIDLEFTFLGYCATTGGTCLTYITAAQSTTDVSNTWSSTTAGLGGGIAFYKGTAGAGVPIFLHGKRTVTGLTSGVTYTYGLYGATDGFTAVFYSNSSYIPYPHNELSAKTY